ncbi:MAG TPA: hypothetical protein DCS93_39225 [Microscillaceae bacterium]|nr:hypothetical protein [Microscillaceae bacterium]
MKKTHIIILWTLLIGLALQSCNNTTNDPAPTGTTTNANLLNTWKVSQVLEVGADVTTAYTSYRITFAEANGQQTFNLTTRTGTTQTGTWALSTDQTTLTLTLADGTSLTFSGVNISASELKYTSSEAGKTGSVSVNFTLIPA